MTCNVLMGTLNPTHSHCRDITQFYLHTLRFIRKRNEPSAPQLVLIYRPCRDGGLSRPWCEVAPAEIRAHNLTIANLALYQTEPLANTTGWPN